MPFRLTGKIGRIEMSTGEGWKGYVCRYQQNLEIRSLATRSPLREEAMREADKRVCLSLLPFAGQDSELLPVYSRSAITMSITQDHLVSLYQFLSKYDAKDKLTALIQYGSMSTEETAPVVAQVKS